mmetsp:Transcript_28155/g.41887  ORF Transcript_28155/g.41887 Transcript_28155/m.41887 type:complete len:80 (+) Transcript_28155:170-409(+)
MIVRNGNFTTTRPMKETAWPKLFANQKATGPRILIFDDITDPRLSSKIEKILCEMPETGIPKSHPETNERYPSPPPKTE